MSPWRVGESQCEVRGSGACLAASCSGGANMVYDVVVSLGQGGQGESSLCSSRYRGSGSVRSVEGPISRSCSPWRDCCEPSGQGGHTVSCSNTLAIQRTRGLRSSPLGDEATSPSRPPSRLDKEVASTPGAQSQVSQPHLGTGSSALDRHRTSATLFETTTTTKTTKTATTGVLCTSLTFLFVLLPDAKNLVGGSSAWRRRERRLRSWWRHQQQSVRAAWQQPCITAVM